MRADFITYSLYLLLYSTYNSFTLPFQGRTLNTGAAEANLRGFPLPQAPGWGAILQFLTSISKCKEARNFRLGIFRSVNKYHYATRRRPGSKSVPSHANRERYLLRHADKADSAGYKAIAM